MSYRKQYIPFNSAWYFSQSESHSSNQMFPTVTVAAWAFASSFFSRPISLIYPATTLWWSSCSFLYLSPFRKASNSWRMALFWYWSVVYSENRRFMAASCRYPVYASGIWEAISFIRSKLEHSNWLRCSKALILASFSAHSFFNVSARSW